MDTIKNQKKHTESPSSNRTNDSAKFIESGINDDCKSEKPPNSPPPPRFPKAYRDFSRSILLLNFIVHFFLQYFSLVIYPFPRKRLLSLLHSLPKTNGNMLGNTDHAKNGFQILIDELAKYNQLSGYGRVAFAKYVTYSLHGRRDFINYLNAHPDICDVDIGQPCIITGLHRTGTTLLHRLMALDPTCRTTTPLDTFPITNFPLVPPIRSEEERMNHPRAKQWINHTLKAWKKHAPEEYRMTLRNHRFDPFETEEELILFQQYGSFTFQSALLDPLTNSMAPKPRIPPSPATSYTEWYLDETAQSDAILLVKRYLQAFHQAWAPTSHWCLKAPQYSLFPTALYTNFPKARYIIAHRDPVVAVSSGARLFAESLTAYVESETLDLHGIGKNVLNQSALKLERLNRLRQEICDRDPDLEKAQFLDVNFNEIVGDPIGTLKKIYGHFGMPFTPEHEAAVIKYLAQDKVRRKEEREGGGKPLRRPLDLADFGLTTEIVRGRFPPEEFCDGRVEIVVKNW